MSQIKLNYVKLKNFKKHADLEIEFGDALTVIKGPNYSGKSSAFQGVYFALFGTKAVPGGKAVIVRQGAKNCSAMLQFDIGSRHMIIERTMTTASLHEQQQDESGNWQDVLIATGPSAVTEWVEATLGQPAAQYMLLTYSRQGTAAGLLDFGAPALNRVIEGLANADYVEQVIVACGKRVQQAQGVLDAIGPVEDPAPLRVAYREAQRAEAGAQMKLGRARAEEDILRAVESDTLAAMKAVQAEEVKWAKTERQLEALQAEMVSFQNQRTALAKWKEVSAIDVAPLAAEVTSASDEYSQMVSYKASYDAAVAALKKDQQAVAKLDYSAKDNASRDAYEAAKKEAEAAFAVLVDLETQVADITRELNAAKQEQKKAVCTACQRPFDASHATRVAEQIKRLESEQAKLAPKLDAARTASEKATAVQSSIERNLPPAGWKEKWEAAAASVKELEAELADAEEVTAEEIGSLKDCYEHAVAEVQRANQSNTLRAGELAKLSKLEEMIGASESVIETIKAQFEGRAEIDVRAAQDAHQSALETWRAQSDVRQQFEREHAGFVAQLQALAGMLERAEKAAGRRKDAEHDLDRHQRLQKWLRDSKATFLGQIWETVLSVTSAFARAATFGAIEEVMRSPQGDFSYREGGVELPIDAASGGQCAIIGIGLRLALASLLPQGAGLLVLDEPSADLNNEHAAVLAGTLKAQGIQILLVTHREGEEYAADKTVVFE